MKTKLIIEERTARLVVECESEFEKEMVKQLESLPERNLTISTEQNWGRTVGGIIAVDFATRP